MPPGFSISREYWKLVQRRFLSPTRRVAGSPRVLLESLMISSRSPSSEGSCRRGESSGKEGNLKFESSPDSRRPERVTVFAATSYV